MNKKTILISITLLTTLTVFSGCTKKQPVENVPVDNQTTQNEQNQNTDNQASTTTETEVFTSDIDTSDWQTYRNEEYGFELKYPNDWIIGNSIDGGDFSYVPFYLEEKYSEECVKEENGSSICKLEGKVFEIKISLTGKNNNTSTTGEEFSINGIDGLITKENQKREINTINPFVDEKTIMFYLPKVNGVYLSFKKSISSEDDKLLFDNILKNLSIN